ncbi:Arc family DNA-binding protein [Pleomorphomonas carboxyditropha]|nr:Arc family DNA-binding protein [Pleomorphomonas carboxyditropha]
MARDDLQVNVRIPADLKAALEAKANSNYRSLTGEIVARLWRTLEEDDLLNAVAGDVEDLKERVKNLEDERRIAYDGD